MSITAVTASTCLVLGCGAALLDDASFLLVVAAAAIVGLVVFGVGRLLAAAGPSRR